MGGLFLGMSPLAKLFLSKGAPLSLVTNAVETLGKVGTMQLGIEGFDRRLLLGYAMQYGHFRL